MSSAEIIEGLNEALAWTEGKSTLPVTMPGEPRREMTVAEYQQANTEARVLLAELERELGVKGATAVFREALARVKAARAAIDSSDLST